LDLVLLVLLATIAFLVYFQAFTIPLKVRYVTDKPLYFAVIAASIGLSQVIYITLGLLGVYKFNNKIL